MPAQRAYYSQGRSRFLLLGPLDKPAWRPPQLGALGALLAHWSTPHAAPALISMPTGTGKTAVGIAAAYLAASRRVLVVVPSTELRRQIAAAFRGEDALIRVGALSGGGDPLVMEVSGRIEQWEALEAADVVVALPNSISPVHYDDNPPPTSLFDLIVVDEAHHAPAPTWRAILDHFGEARAVLLTATPRRRDGRSVPGDHVYHYPLRQALDEGIFKPVESRLLNLPGMYTRESLDDRIADEVARELKDPAHATSTVLVRAASRARAAALASLYEARGVPIRVLHSGLGRATQQSIIDGLRAGEHRAVAVVGMLIEGFDLPSLRMVAYHDKHKSLPATAQLIGRLARVDERFPQPSVLVTARDIDVFPELRGIVRSLYEEDGDWATVLPGILDDEIAEDIANREYAQAFTPPPPALSLEAVHPLRRAILLEVPTLVPWVPPFADGALPSELEPGHLLRGRTILYAGLNRDASTLAVVTTTVVRPRWHDDPGLDSPRDRDGPHHWRPRGPVARQVRWRDRPERARHRPAGGSGAGHQEPQMDHRRRPLGAARGPDERSRLPESHGHRWKPRPARGPLRREQHLGSAVVPPHTPDRHGTRRDSAARSQSSAPGGRTGAGRAWSIRGPGARSTCRLPRQCFARRAKHHRVVLCLTTPPVAEPTPGGTAVGCRLAHHSSSRRAAACSSSRLRTAAAKRPTTSPVRTSPTLRQR